MASRRIFCVDASAPGLRKYGLQYELDSDSESDDTDFNPSRTGIKRKRITSSSSSSSSSPQSESTSVSTDESNVKPIKKLSRGKKKSQTGVLKKKKKIRTFRKFGEDISYTNDSSDSDYQPAKRGKNLKHKAKEEKGALTVKRVGVKKRSFGNKICSDNTGDDTWSTLPVEILSKIFKIVCKIDSKGAKYVFRCSAVCKWWWYNVAMQPLSWEYADLSFAGGSNKADSAVLIRLCENIFQNLKVLIISGWKNLTDSGLLSVAKSCPKLEILNIGHCQKKSVAKVSADSLLQIAENCAIKNIDLSSLRIPVNYDKAVVNFIKTCGENLTHINLSGNVACSSKVMSCILLKCHSLLSLDISNTSVRTMCFETLQNSCPHLEELYLANLGLETKPLKNKNVTGFKNLKICSMACNKYVFWLSDILFLQIMRTSVNLKVLDIRGSCSLTESAFLIPASSVERLYISRCKISKLIVQTITSKWSNTLSHLDLSWVEAVGIPFDMLIQDFVNGPYSCKKLVHIDLTGTSITDLGVKSIVKGCQHLETLDLTSCRGITRGIKRLHNNIKDFQMLKRLCK